MKSKTNNFQTVQPVQGTKVASAAAIAKYISAVELKVENLCRTEQFKPAMRISKNAFFLISSRAGENTDARARANNLIFDVCIKEMDAKVPLYHLYIKLDCGAADLGKTDSVKNQKAILNRIEELSSFSLD